ncbi:hypothetical protein T492DRAFT_843605 [Pavlovales sp. CCMP2436]|nr:hypothetical protein T492DRAFT_843605 [Pavlovales sp. CCMP2436]
MAAEECVPCAPAVELLEPGTIHSVPCAGGPVRVLVSDQGKILRSRPSHSNLCRRCGALIAAYDFIWPLEAEAKHKLSWVHLACAARALGEPLVPPPCKHYVRAGYCLFHEKCFFTHAPGIAPTSGPVAFSEEQARLEGLKRRGERVAAARGPKLPPAVDGGKPARCRHRVRNTHRAATIRRWLVATYGLERLAKGSGVLEVAGGKGEISFQLVKINGVPATNVDPRPGRLGNYRRAWQWGFYTRNRIFEHLDVRAETEAAVGAEAEPRLIRTFFEMDNLRRSRQTKAGRRVAAAAAAVCGEGAEPDERAPPQAVPRFALDGEAWAAQSERAQQYRWTNRGLVRLGPGKSDDGAAPAAGEGGEEGEGKGEEEGGGGGGCCACGCERDEAHGGGGEGDDDEEEEGAEADRPQLVRSLEEAREILAGVSMVVSMHGDAAVDHALEFALSAGVPFALVPCCVYRELSPWREGVTTYDQMLCHLEERAWRAGVLVERTTLGFEGKNQALFSPPPPPPGSI